MIELCYVLVVVDRIVAWHIPVSRSDVSLLRIKTGFRSVKGQPPVSHASEATRRSIVMQISFCTGQILCLSKIAVDLGTILAVHCISRLLFLMYVHLLYSITYDPVSTI